MSGAVEQLDFLRLFPPQQYMPNRSVRSDVGGAEPGDFQPLFTARASLRLFQEDDSIVSGNHSWQRIGGVGVVELPVTRDYQAWEICLVRFEMFFEYKTLATLRWQI